MWAQRGQRLQVWAPRPELCFPECMAHFPHPAGETRVNTRSGDYHQLQLSTFPNPNHKDENQAFLLSANTYVVGRIESSSQL